MTLSQKKVDTIFEYDKRDIPKNVIAFAVKTSVKSVYNTLNNRQPSDTFAYTRTITPTSVSPEAPQQPLTSGQTQYYTYHNQKSRSNPSFVSYDESQKVTKENATLKQIIQHMIEKQDETTTELQKQRTAAEQEHQRIVAQKDQELGEMSQQVTRLTNERNTLLQELHNQKQIENQRNQEINRLNYAYEQAKKEKTQEKHSYIEREKTFKEEIAQANKRIAYLKTMIDNITEEKNQMTEELQKLIEDQNDNWVTYLIATLGGFIGGTGLGWYFGGKNKNPLVSEKLNNQKNTGRNVQLNQENPRVHIYTYGTSYKTDGTGTIGIRLGFGPGCGIAIPKSIIYYLNQT